MIYIILSSFFKVYFYKKYNGMQIDSNSNSDFDKMHKDAKFWNMAIKLYKYDLRFITTLLNGKIFKQNSPNLFERIAQWKLEIQELEEKIINFLSKIREHEHEMSGLIECDDISCDITYINRHQEIETLFREQFLYLQKEKQKILDFVESALQK